MSQKTLKDLVEEGLAEIRLSIASLGGPPPPLTAEQKVVFAALVDAHLTVVAELRAAAGTKASSANGTN